MSGTTQSPATDIAFVFDDVPNYEDLVAAFLPGVDVHVLDARRNGLAQMADTLQGRSDIDALHVVGHGEAGALDLGSVRLTSRNIGEHDGALGQIGASLVDGGDILLYGCNVAFGAAGARFVEQIALATGANVAASTDATGSAQRGGNWTLEFQTGPIAPNTAFDAAAVRNVDTLLGATFEDVMPGMTTGPGNFVPSFTLVTAQTVYDDPANGVNGGIYFDTLTESESFTVSADGTSVGSFDLTGMTWVKAFTFGEFTISITGHRADGSTATAVIYTAQNASTFSVTDGFTDMTKLTSFDVTITGTSTDAGAGSTPADLTLDGFTVNNIVLPAPSTPQLTAATDTGSSSSDRITNANTVAFTGTGPAGDSTDTVQVFIDKNNNGAYDAGTDVSGTATLTNGNWTVSGLSTTGLADGSYKVYAQLSSAGGSSALSAPQTITIDHTAPTVTITSDHAALAIGQTATVTFTFSEDPGSTFTSGDIAVGGGTLSALSGTGLVRTATFTPVANTNNGTASITVTGGSFTDTAGNNGNAGTTPNITFDTLAPTLSITSDKASVGSGQTATVTFTFSEDPGASFSWDGTNGDVVVQGGTLSAISGTGLTRTAVFTPDIHSATGSIAVTAGSYTDAAGNSGAGATSATLSLDTTPPAAPSTPVFATGSDSGTSASDGLTNVTTPTLAGTAEAGATVKLYDGATLVGTGTADGGGNWSITTSTLGQGDHTIAAVATDAAGNVGPASGQLDVMIDTTPPTLTITSDVSALKAGQTATVTFTFSEDPGATISWDGTHGDIAVSGGTLSALSGTGLTRTAIFTPDANTNNGNASITVANGAYTDAAGNAGGAGTTPSLHFDTLAPTVTITSDVPALKVGETAVITFTFSEDPGASFAWDGSSGDITVSGGTLSAVSGTGLTRTAIFTPDANTNNGNASITVAYTDAAGNAGGTGTTPSLHFDTLAPDAPYAVALAAGSDTGTNASDGLTNATTPTFTGMAEAGATVKLYDGATLVGSGIADGGGNWTIVTSTLAEGDHTMAAIAIDAAGNTSTASGQLDVVIDTTPPTVAITSDTAALKVGETATITFTFSEDPGSTISWDGTHGNIAVSGGTLSALSGTGLTRTAVFTPDANTNSGTASITVANGAYTDAAGNAGGAGATPSLTFDTLAPAVTITSDVASLHAGQTAIITFTFTEDPGASFAWDGSSGGVTVSGGTLSALSGTGLTRTAVFTPDADTNGGTASITVASGSYSDAAGNTGAAGHTPSLTFDTLAPAAPSAPVLDAASDTGASVSDNLTNLTTPTLTGTAEAGSSVTLYDTDGTTVIGSGTADGTGHWSIATSTLSEGAHTITALATDGAGNAGPLSAAATVTVDATAPAAPTAPALAAGSDNGLSSTDGLTSVTTPTLTGTAEDGATVTLHDTDGTVLGSAVATGGVWSITSSALADGTHVLSATATDAAGNTGLASDALTIAVDTAAPTTTIASIAFSSDTGSSNHDLVTSTAAQTISGTTSAPLAAGEFVFVSLDHGATWTEATTAVGSTTWSVSATLTASNTIDVHVVDAAGNTGATLSHDYVLDTTAPSAPGALDLATASDTGNSSTDNITSDTTPTITGSAESGSTVTLYDTDGTTVLGTTVAVGGIWSITSSTLDQGTHALTATATDAAGNTSGASGVLSITIDDTPSLTLVGTRHHEVLVGGAGNDVLDGMGGHDTMIGGAGDDTYYVDSRHDRVIEAPGQGVDQVISTADFVLPDNVEMLTLAGSSNIAGTGNALDNVIVGNAGNNRITGGLGADTLTGGLGADTFVYRSVAESSATPGGWDVITDFSSAQGDRIDLSGIDADAAARHMQAFVFIGSAQFSTTDATGQLRFDSATHMLYGSTNADATPEFAIELAGVTSLTVKDIVL